MHLYTAYSKSRLLATLIYILVYFICFIVLCVVLDSADISDDAVAVPAILCMVLFCWISSAIAQLCTRRKVTLELYGDRLKVRSDEYQSSTVLYSDVTSYDRSTANWNGDTLVIKRNNNSPIRLTDRRVFFFKSVSIVDLTNEFTALMVMRIKSSGEELTNTPVEAAPLHTPTNTSDFYRPAPPTLAKEPTLVATVKPVTQLPDSIKSVWSAAFYLLMALFIGLLLLGILLVILFIAGGFTAYGLLVSGMVAFGLGLYSIVRFERNAPVITCDRYGISIHNKKYASTHYNWGDVEEFVLTGTVPFKYLWVIQVKGVEIRFRNSKTAYLYSTMYLNYPDLCTYIDQSVRTKKNKY